LILHVEKDTLSGMMRNFRRLCASSALAQAVLLVAGSGAAFGQINLYVPNFNNTPPNVSEFNINGSTGVLSVVAGQPSTTTDNNPTRVAMTPNSKFLYITSGNNQLDAYSVSPTGALTVIQAQPGYAVVAPVGLVATNSFVYVASSAGSIAVFSINSSTGALTPVTCGACSTGAGSAPQNLVLDPTNSFLYVALPGTNAIGVGTIGAGGALTAFTNAYTGGANFTPQDLALTPTGGTLYASNFLGPSPFTGTNFITSFTVSGATVGGATTVTVGNSPNGLAIDPSGKFLFVANQGSGTVSAYTIGGGGALTAVPGSPFVSGTGASHPTGASVDPTGNFLYVSNQANGTVSGYSITQSGASAGALTPVAGSPFTTGTGPWYLLAHLAPSTTVPAASTWSLAMLGILLVGMAGLLYRKAYR
jgi:6-phosphogluconolactonase (cycloisomerase 2 family)